MTKQSHQSATCIAKLFRYARSGGKLPGILLSMASMPALADVPPSPIGMSGEVIDGGFMLQFFAGLGLVLLCIVVLAWIMKRAGGLQSSARGALKIVDGIALSARERVVLVQVGDQQVLLGVAPGRVNRVHVLDEPVSHIEAGAAQPGTFADRLRDVLQRERTS